MASILVSLDSWRLPLAMVKNLHLYKSSGVIFCLRDQDTQNMIKAILALRLRVSRPTNRHHS